MEAAYEMIPFKADAYWLFIGEILWIYHENKMSTIETCFHNTLACYKYLMMSNTHIGAIVMPSLG